MSSHQWLCDGHNLLHLRLLASALLFPIPLIMLMLQEKLSTQDVLTRTSARATTNFTLASKLAQKIGQQQAEIMDLLAQTSSSTSTSSDTSSSNTATATDVVGREPNSSTSGLYSYSRPGKSFSSSAASSSNSDRPGKTTSSSSNNSFASDCSFIGSSANYEAPWEKGLREARQRVAEAEAQATATGSKAEAAGWDACYKARETIEVRSST